MAVLSPQAGRWEYTPSLRFALSRPTRQKSQRRRRDCERLLLDQIHDAGAGMGARAGGGVNDWHHEGEW